MVNQVGGRRRHTVHAVIPNIGRAFLLCASNGAVALAVCGAGITDCDALSVAVFRGWLRALRG